MFNIILVQGIAGSGKSTLCKLYRGKEDLEYDYISMDDYFKHEQDRHDVKAVREDLFKTTNPSEIIEYMVKDFHSATTYTRWCIDKFKHFIIDIFIENRLDRNLIIEVPFINYLFQDTIERVCLRYNHSFQSIVITASEDVIKQRLKERNWSDGRIDLTYRLFRYYANH